MPIPRPAAGQTKWWVVGIVGVVLGTAMATWWALSATSSGLSWTDAGHSKITDRSITVRFDIRAKQDQGVTCTIKALAVDHSTVGSTDVTFPPSKYPSTRYNVTVRTTQRATTGTVEDCVYAP